MPDSTPTPESSPAEVTLDMMRESLTSAIVCDALDSLGYTKQSPRVPLRPYTTDGVLVGYAKTTLWADMAHEDSKPYELELKAVDESRPDEVFICAASGSMRSAMWGELLSTAASARGAVGAIVDGAIRDVTRMRQMRFPVFARGTSVYDSKNRQRVIDVDVSVEIDSVTFSPGDLIFADVDGVTVVPGAAVEATIRKAWEKVHAEAITRDAFKSGLSASETFEKYGVL